MFDKWFNWTTGICDWCYTDRFHVKAMNKAPDCFDENSGAWRGGGSGTPEQRAKWTKALEETTEEMTTMCLELATSEGEIGRLCEHCLKKVLGSKEHGS